MFAAIREMLRPAHTDNSVDRDCCGRHRVLFADGSAVRRLAEGNLTSHRQRARSARDSVSSDTGSRFIVFRRRVCAHIRSKRFRSAVVVASRTHAFYLTNNPKSARHIESREWIHRYRQHIAHARSRHDRRSPLWSCGCADQSCVVPMEKGATTSSRS